MNTVGFSWKTWEKSFAAPTFSIRISQIAFRHVQPSIYTNYNSRLLWPRRKVPKMALEAKAGETPRVEYFTVVRPWMMAWLGGECATGAYTFFLEAAHKICRLNILRSLDCPIRFLLFRRDVQRSSVGFVTLHVDTQAVNTVPVARYGEAIA